MTLHIVNVNSSIGIGGYNYFDYPVAYCWLAVSFWEIRALYIYIHPLKGILQSISFSPPHSLLTKSKALVQDIVDVLLAPANVKTTDMILGWFD